VKKERAAEKGLRQPTRDEGQENETEEKGRGTVTKKATRGERGVGGQVGQPEL